MDGGDYFGLGCAPDGWDNDYWYDMRNYLEQLTPEDRLKSRSPDVMKRGGVGEDFCYAHGVSDRAIDYIGKKSDEDFLLVVSYDEPHAPFLCPEPYASMYDDYEFPKDLSVYDNLDGKPDYQKIWAGDVVNRNPDDVKIIRPDLFGCNSYVDYEIGRVLDTAKAMTPDAMIIYTSDHGDFLEGHCLTKKGSASYDSISRIPLIIKTKDGLKGEVYDQIISHIGMTPAILEYFGIPIPKRLQGKSLLKTAYDLSYMPEQYCFIEYGRQEVDHDTYGGFLPLRCVVSDKYKLTINLMSTDELYDLENDPYETNNIILLEETAKERDRLHDVLLNWMDESRDPFRGYVWYVRPWRKDAVATWKCSGYTRQRENEEYEPRQLDYVTGLPMVEPSRPK